MGSKAFLFLGLALAVVLLITSEVAARELDEIPTPSYQSDNYIPSYGDFPKPPGYGGFPIPPGYSGGDRNSIPCTYKNGCKKRRSDAGEAVEVDTETEPKN